MSQTRNNNQGYRFLEHVTDAFIEAWAPDIQHAFATAATALYDTMIHVEKVESKFTREIQADGHDELELLYNWLEALLIRFEVDNEAYSRFEVQPIQQDKQFLHLTATAAGEIYNPQKHGAKTGVKGVTYHQMIIEKQSNQVLVRFLLDL